MCRGGGRGRGGGVFVPAPWAIVHTDYGDPGAGSGVLILAAWDVQPTLYTSYEGLYLAGSWRKATPI